MLIGIILVVAVFGGAGVAVGWKLWKLHLEEKNWEWLRAAVVPFQWRKVDYVDPRELMLKVDAAFKALQRHGPWVAAQLIEALSNMRVSVNSESNWEYAGGRVAGQTFEGKLVLVARNMETLCHEMAHVCEMHFDALPDYNHARWSERGLSNAEDAFLAVVRAPK